METVWEWCSVQILTYASYLIADLGQRKDVSTQGADLNLVPVRGQTEYREVAVAA